MAQVAIVGVAAGIGGLFLCAAGFVLYQIILRKREHNREIAEIEQGFPTATETTQNQGSIPCQLPFIPAYSPCGGWNALSSSDSIYQPPPFTQINDRVHPAFVCPPEQPRVGWSFPGMRPRIGQMPPKARKIQALSAIIESPRGTPNDGSRNSPATVSGEQRDPSSVGEQQNTQICVPPSPTPKVPPRSASRPAKRVESPAQEAAMKEFPRPRAARSKSLGTVSDPPKSDLHKRGPSITTPAPGPAPSGPLPPLPPLPPNIMRRNHYDPSNRHSALELASLTHNESPATSVCSSPDRNWERILSSRDLGRVEDPSTGTNLQPELHTQAGAEHGNTSLFADNLRNPRSERPSGHRRSLVRLSITSDGSKRNSCSSITSSFERQANRLSIPEIITADRISISRVSSSGSLNSNTSSVQIVGTPQRRTLSSRVSASGSPVERLRSVALGAVTGNTTSQRPMRSSFITGSTDHAPDWERPALKPRHSILKGSPSARIGHRRQTCVRLSTTPTIWSPESRYSSSSLMDEVMEESPKGRNGIRSPVADKHVNGDVTLRPRASNRLTRFRASLTPNSPALSLATYQQEPLASGNGFGSARTSWSSPRPKSPLSREVSLFSIPSLPSFSHVEDDDEMEETVSTPAIEFTRPSTEHERTPPFGLRVTPSGSTHDLYDPESSSLPSWPREYDPSWPLVTTDPPASGKVYDPCRPISVYSSAEESSSPDFPFAVKNEGAVDKSSPPPVFALEDDEQDAWTQGQPIDYPRDHNKENEFLSPKSAAREFPSPFKSMPILRPRSSNSDTTRLEAPPSPSSSICKTPPLMRRPDSSASVRTIGSGASSNRLSNSHRSSRNPRRRSKGGIDKTRKRMTGPRPSPPKDVRKSIMALRRMNSEMQIEDSSMGRGFRRYLRLGRQASPTLEWEFEEEAEKEEDDDDDDDTEAGQDNPPADLLVELLRSSSPLEGLARSSPSPLATTSTRECHYVSYSAPVPALSLLTTLPSPARTPRAVTVWDAGEDFWAKQEQCVTHAITASPVDTPTMKLDRILEGEALGEKKEEEKDAGKKEEEVAGKGKEWKRGRMVLETPPKSGRGLYDQQGFLRT